MKQPWMKFYPADWRADPALRMCEPMSRYVWLEMIGLMHDAEPYGHLLVNGKPVTDEALSRLIDVPLKTVRQSMKELARNGVFSVTDDEIIFSRRMVRDEMRATSNRDNGKRGGNPVLTNQEVSTSSVNPLDKRGVKAQKPEARSHIPDKVFSDENTKPRDALSILSDVLDDERCRAVLEHRKSKRAKNTVYAIGLLADQLKACPDPKAAADEMILRNWTTVKPEWLERDKTGPPKPVSAFRSHQDACRAELEKHISGAHFDEFAGQTIDL